MRQRFLPAAIIFSMLSGCGFHSLNSPRESAVREVSVAAASDLRFALDELVRRFAREYPEIRVSAAYGSSGNYYSQLSNQAPFDVFLSADLEFPRRLAKQGLTLPGSEFSYAVGRIVLWVPASSVIDLEKLRMDALRHPSVKHVAIANPQHAPYGQAALAALRSYGVYAAVEPRLVFGENIAQTLQFIQSGNAEIGVVALSLALAPTLHGQGRYWEIPLERYPKMEQGGVILKWAKDPEAARAFRAFLLKPQGKSTLAEFGFTQPEQ